MPKDDVSTRCTVTGCGKEFHHPLRSQNTAALTLHTLRKHKAIGPGHGTYAAGKPGAKAFGGGSKRWKKTFPAPDVSPSPAAVQPDPGLTSHGKTRALKKDGTVRLGWGEKKRAQGIEPLSPAHKNGYRNYRKKNPAAPTTSLADAIAALEVKRDSMTDIINDLKRMG